MPGNFEAQRRLADPSDTGESDEPMLCDEIENLPKRGVSADQFEETTRKIGGRGGSLASRFGTLPARVSRLDVPGELVAASSNSTNQVTVRAECLAQR